LVVKDQEVQNENHYFKNNIMEPKRGKKKFPGDDDENRSPKKVRITIPEQRKYYTFGRFNAKGPAALIKIEELTMRGIEWSSLRVFFRPNDGTLHSLRVKPTKTNIYGPELKVFAIPPAPVQWVKEIRKRQERQKQQQNISVHIEMFIEDMDNKQFYPYGNVVYIFSPDPPPFYPLLQGNESQILVLVSIYLLYLTSNLAVFACSQALR
jgi:hypothetical protein